MSRGATARLFVAIDPPPELSRALVDWAREVVGASIVAAPRRGRRHPRVLPAESLHLTLCFLGSRPVGEIPALGAAIEACAEELGELSIGAPLWLPPRRPKALAVEVHERTGALGRLQQSLVRELSSASGWEPERRRFRAHITLARLKDGIPARAARLARSAGAGRPERPTGAPGGGEEEAALAPTPQLSFTPRAVLLYRSLLEPEGAVYEALASSELGGRG